MIVQWLTYKVLAYIAGALAIAVVGLGVLLWAAEVRVDRAQVERDEARNAVTAAQQTIKGQVRLLSECDAATKRLEVEGNKRQAEAEKRLSDAKTEAGRYQQEVKRLRALAGRPTPSGADCRQALREIRK